MKRLLKLTLTLVLLCSLQSCATIGRTVQAVGRTVGNATGIGP